MLILQMIQTALLPALKLIISTKEVLMFHGLQPRIVFVNDDNLDLFQHYSGRLMVLVRKMYHPEFDAFGEDHFRSQDPVAYYNAL